MGRNMSFKKLLPETLYTQKGKTVLSRLIIDYPKL